MFNQELTKISEYMAMGNPRAAEVTRQADWALVFCREDPKMAEAAAALWNRGMVEHIILSGGIGKDSGPESTRRGAEAYWQHHLLSHVHNVPEHVIHIETKAKDGAGNSRNGIDIMQKFSGYGLPFDRVILVAPSLTARRLYAAHTKIAREEKGFSAEYEVVIANDPFNADYSEQLRTLLGEFLRVADWPAKNWSDPQPDLDLHLVVWARSNLSR